MRKFPIWMWLALALLAVIVLPPLAAWVSFQLLPAAYPDGSRGQLIGTVERQPDKWQDPAWQADLRRRLAEVKLNVILLDDDRQELFRSEPAHPEDGRGLPIRSAEGPLSVWNRQVYYGPAPWTAYFYGDPSEAGLPHAPLSDSVIDRLPVLVGAGALAMSLAGAAWMIWRWLLKPLAATSLAARQIARGDLEFELPQSRVWEVAEVSAAFAAMGEALKLSLQRQTDIEQERRLFISAVAHDLRSPLFSLRGFLEGLEKGLANTPERASQYLSICRDKANLLDRLVEDLFAYSQLEYLEEAPRRGPVDIGALLSKVVAGLQHRADTKAVLLQVDGDAAPYTLAADEHLLMRAVENLLDNALRHTPPGGQIRVEWHRLKHQVVFMVTDTGPGIDPKDLPHLFKPLYRGEPSRNRATGGAGLGLAVARRILLAHGGDLSATNDASGGARFIANVPGDSAGLYKCPEGAYNT